MKKILCLMLAAVLLCCAAFAETEDMRAFYNPNGYSLLLVSDAFVLEDGQYVVQGCFGEFDYSDEANAQTTGFDENEVFTLVMDENAVIEMPESLYTIEDNVPATRDAVVAFADEMREELNNVYFFCEYEMNEAGVLTKLIYYSLPY